MLHSSIGFHTFTVFRVIEADEMRRIIKDFKAYSTSTRNIKIIPSENNKWNIEINYTDPYKGLRWLCRLCNCSEDSTAKLYSIEATINPKTFTGIKDYVTAANENCLSITETEFNREARSISRVLGVFLQYKLKRIDYCANFKLPELEIGCTAEQMMSLMKRGNIPAHYTERKTYGELSHRPKSDDSTFYLVSNSVVINCYDKYVQLIRNYPDNPSVEDAVGVIRFEIQCKYLKTYALADDIRRNGCCDYRITNALLANDLAKDIIVKYYNRVVMRGDYYPLKDAIAQVEAHHFKESKEERLKWVLNMTNRCRGISKAKETLASEELEDYSSGVRELGGLGINPVTIPKEWNIKRIPNLLDAFFDKLNSEQAQERHDEFMEECLGEYFADRKSG